MKRVLLILLTLTIVCSFTVPVFAEETTEDVEHEGGGGSFDDSTWFDRFTGWFGNLGNSISNLGTKIGEFFDDLVEDIKGLFIPGYDYEDGFMGYVQDRLEEFHEQNQFIQVIRNFGEELNILLHSDFKEPPKVLVDLSAAEGKYNYGFGKVNLLDFSWFERYRKYTDPLLSAVLWCGFLWALFKRLPDILNGAGFVTEMPFTVAEGAYTLDEKHDREIERKERNKKIERYHRRNGGNYIK